GRARRMAGPDPARYVRPRGAPPRRGGRGGTGGPRGPHDHADDGPGTHLLLPVHPRPQGARGADPHLAGPAVGPDVRELTAGRGAVGAPGVRVPRRACGRVRRGSVSRRAPGAGSPPRRGTRRSAWSGRPPAPTG